MKNYNPLIYKILTVFLTIFILFPSTLQAKTISYPDTWLTVKLITVEIPTTYKQSEYDVIYEIENGIIYAKIVDRSNDDIVSQYSESITLAQNGYYFTIINGYYDLVKEQNVLQAYVSIGMKIHVGSYYKECVELILYDHSITENNAFKLVDSHTFDGTDSYPTNKVRIDINGLVQATSNSLLSYKKLKKNGFDMTNNAYGIWQGQLSYNTGASFVIMS